MAPERLRRTIRVPDQGDNPPPPGAPASPGSAGPAPAGSAPPAAASRQRRGYSRGETVVGPYKEFEGEKGPVRYVSNSVLNAMSAGGMSPWHREFTPLDVIDRVVDQLGGDSSAIITGADGKPYYLLAASNVTNFKELEAAALNRYKDGNAKLPDSDFFRSAVLAKFPDATEITPEIEQTVLRDARVMSKLRHMVGANMGNPVGNFALKTGADLLSDKQKIRANALNNLNITAEQLAEVYGPGDAIKLRTEVGKKLLSGSDSDLRDGLVMLGLAQEQVDTVMKRTANGFQMPYLKELPVVAHIGGIGAASAGVGALAAYAMAQGQQQPDPLAYAQVAAAMNAY